MDNMNEDELLEEFIEWDDEQQQQQARDNAIESLLLMATERAKLFSHELKRAEQKRKKKIENRQSIARTINALDARMREARDIKAIYALASSIFPLAFDKTLQAKKRLAKINRAIKIMQGNKPYVLDRIAYSDLPADGTTLDALRRLLIAEGKRTIREKKDEERAEKLSPYTDKGLVGTLSLSDYAPPKSTFNLVQQAQGSGKLKPLSIAQRTAKPYKHLVDRIDAELEDEEAIEKPIASIYFEPETNSFKVQQTKVVFRKRKLPK